MSEYQFYEYRTIDRSLSPEDIGALRSIAMGEGDFVSGFCH